MVLSLQDDESKGTENIWKENGFFGDQRAELTILKANFPENTLVYVNQGTVSLVKGGDKAIYLDFVVVGQIMPSANVDPKIDFDKYEYKANKVSLMDLSMLNTDARDQVKGSYYKIVKKIAEVSNQNLVTNSNAFISSGGKIDPYNEFCWIDDSYKMSKEKFQLTY